jgi:hypothetical protein
MESQDGESANEVPVVRKYKHTETLDIRFTGPFPKLRFEANIRLLYNYVSTI